VKSILFCSLLVLFSSQVMAQTSGGSLFDPVGARDFPVELEEVQGGYPESPVVPCPRPSERYVNLLSQLNSIKATIQSQACRDAGIEEQNIDILLGRDRERFLGLVDQGLFGEGQLSTDEVESVENYVQNVVSYAAVLTGLTNNAACFNDDQKQSTLSFLSSVISEASGAIGALAGPFGAKISLGGKIAGSLLGSVDQIVRARQTYDYTDINDIDNYFNNLCTYHDFKVDLDIETDLFDYRNRLNGVYQKANEYLAAAEASCEDCAFIIDEYEARENRNGTFNLPSGAASLDDLSALDTRVRSQQVSVGDLTPELAEAFFSRELGQNPFAPENYVEVQPPVRIGRVGTSDMNLEEVLTVGLVEAVQALTPPAATLRALQIRSWTVKKAEEVEQIQREGNGSDGRIAVRALQQEMEHFFINREARNYIRQVRNNLDDKVKALMNQANRMLGAMMINSFHRFSEQSSFEANEENTRRVQVIHEAFHYSFNDGQQFLNEIVDENLTNTEGYERLMELREEYQGFLRDSLIDVVNAYHVVKTKCEFFTMSAFGDNDVVIRECERSQDALDEVKELAQSLLTTDFRDQAAFTLRVMLEPRPNYVSDWVNSIDFALQRDLDVLGDFVSNN
jgi:hypothetical protein